MDFIKILIAPCGSDMTVQKVSRCDFPICLLLLIAKSGNHGDTTGINIFVCPQHPHFVQNLRVKKKYMNRRVINR